MKRFFVMTAAVSFVLLAILISIACAMDAAASEPAAEPIVKTYYGLVFVPQEKDEETERQERLVSEAYAGLEIVEPAEEKPAFDGFLEDCKITYYCTEKYAHICGGGLGLTASGREVEAWTSVAVDPSVIPLGSKVFIDFGDGELVEFRADDTGNAVNGNHIDIAVPTHQEALELGLGVADVWWVE